MRPNGCSTTTISSTNRLGRSATTFPRASTGNYPSSARSRSPGIRVCLASRGRASRTPTVASIPIFCAISAALKYVPWHASSRPRVVNLNTPGDNGYIARSESWLSYLKHAPSKLQRKKTPVFFLHGPSGMPRDCRSNSIEVLEILFQSLSRLESIDSSNSPEGRSDSSDGESCLNFFSSLRSYCRSFGSDACIHNSKV